jgi:hypothetical protein
MRPKQIDERVDLAFEARGHVVDRRKQQPLRGHASHWRNGRSSATASAAH